MATERLRKLVLFVRQIISLKPFLYQSVVKMLTSGSPGAWLPTRTSVTISVVPGKTAERTYSTKSGARVIHWARFLMPGARARPKLAVEIHSLRPSESNLPRAK